MLENVYTVFDDGHRLVFFFCFPVVSAAVFIRFSHIPVLAFNKL